MSFSWFRKKPVKKGAFDLLNLLDFRGFKASSGGIITELSAMQQSTVYACVRILSDCIAMSPLKLMQRNRDGTIAEVMDHPALFLLTERPNEFQTPHDFMQFLVTSIELWGNGYAFKNFLGSGDVGELLPLLPSSVSPDKVTREWALEYHVGDENLMGRFTKEQVFHVRNLSFDGLVGASTVRMQRDAIGLSKSAEDHGAAVFNNGAQLGVVFTMDQDLDDDEYRDLQVELSKYQGAKNAFKPFLATGGMKPTTIGMTPEDAQMLLTRRFQKEDIASIFGIPLFLLQDTQDSNIWGSGPEQITKMFVRFTLKPRFSRLTQRFNMDLLRPGDRMWFKFDSDDLTVGDFKERMEGYDRAIQAGILNPNEARELEGKNPREGGDEYRRPANIGLDAEALPREEEVEDEQFPDV